MEFVELSVPLIFMASILQVASEDISGFQMPPESENMNIRDRIRITTTYMYM